MVMDSLGVFELTRIFHTDSAAACKHLMDTASASNCSSGSMKHTAVVAIHHLPCLHQDSRRLATNQYEIFELTRIFHTDHLRRPGNQMDAALSSNSSSGSVCSHSRRQTSSLAWPHQPSRPPRYDQYEICGLNSSHFSIY
jgi:hypothetical protein